jgi:hypothetical protein
MQPTTDLPFKFRFVQGGRLLQRLPDHPGLLLNQGIGYLHAGDGQHGVEYLNRSLRACSNYQPAMQMLLRLQWVAEESRASSVQT